MWRSWSMVNFPQQQEDVLVIVIHIHEMTCDVSAVKISTVAPQYAQHHYGSTFKIHSKQSNTHNNNKKVHPCIIMHDHKYWPVTCVCISIVLSMHPHHQGRALTTPAKQNKYAQQQYKVYTHPFYHAWLFTNPSLVCTCLQTLHVTSSIDHSLWVKRPMGVNVSKKRNKYME